MLPSHRISASILDGITLSDLPRLAIPMSTRMRMVPDYEISFTSEQNCWW